MWATIALILAVILASAILRALITGDAMMSASTTPLASPFSGQPTTLTPPPANPMFTDGPTINPPFRPPGDDLTVVVIEDDGEIDLIDLIDLAGEVARPAVAEAVVDLDCDTHD